MCCGVRTWNPQNDIRPYILNAGLTMAGLSQRGASQLLVAKLPVQTVIVNSVLNYFLRTEHSHLTELTYYG